MPNNRHPDTDEIVRLYNSGVGPTELAKRFAISPKLVQNRLRHARIKGRITRSYRPTIDMSRPYWLRDWARGRYIGLGTISRLFHKLEPNARDYWLEQLRQSRHERVSDFLADLLTEIADKQS